MTTTPAPARKARRSIIIVPVALLVLALIVYSVVWFKGAGIMRQEIDRFVEEQRAMGRELTHGDIHVEGYPWSLRAQIDDYRWADGDAWAWEGERLYLVTLPYDASRLILAPRDRQELRVGETTYSIAGDALRVGLREDAYSAEAEGLTVKTGGMTLSTGHMVANIAKAEDGYFILGGAIREALFTDADGKSVRAPFFRLAARQDPDAPRGAVVDAMEFALGENADTMPAVMSTRGAVRVDDTDHPAGRFTLTVQNERVLFDLAEEFGILSADEVARARELAESYAAGSGGADLTLPFSMENGQLRLAMIPIARLPQVR